VKTMSQNRIAPNIWLVVDHSCMLIDASYRDMDQVVDHLANRLMSVLPSDMASAGLSIMGLSICYAFSSSLASCPPVCGSVSED